MSTFIRAIADRCIGCHACEMACAIEHSQCDDIEQMALHGETPGYRILIATKNGKPTPRTCRHCNKPACAEACPEGAISRVADGKPVLLDEEKCEGHKACIEACPFGAMFMKPGTKIAMKCDLCTRRLAAGKEPACIEACPTGALMLSDKKVLAGVQ